MNQAGDLWCVRLSTYTFGPFDREAARAFASRCGGEHEPLWSPVERDLLDQKKRLACEIAMVQNRKSA